MKDVSKHLRPPAAATNAPSLPAAVDRATFQAELDTLRLREKAHTREGDAIAAARRRLPMVEVDPTTTLIGADGPVPLIDVFEGRLQLIAYFHMWHTGRPAAEQCEGCTFNNGQVRELSYLHSRDVTFPTPRSAKVRTRRASVTVTSWDGTFRGTRRKTPPTPCSPGASLACWYATCATATACSRRTGPPPAATR